MRGALFFHGGHQLANAIGNAGDREVGVAHQVKLLAPVIQRVIKLLDLLTCVFGLLFGNRHLAAGQVAHLTQLTGQHALCEFLIGGAGVSGGVKAAARTVNGAAECVGVGQCPGGAQRVKHLPDGRIAFACQHGAGFVLLAPQLARGTASGVENATGFVDQRFGSIKGRLPHIALRADEFLKRVEGSIGGLHGGAVRLFGQLAGFFGQAGGGLCGAFGCGGDGGKGITQAHEGGKKSNCRLITCGQAGLRFFYHGPPGGAGVGHGDAYIAQLISNLASDGGGAFLFGVVVLPVALGLVAKGFLAASGVDQTAGQVTAGQRCGQQGLAQGVKRAVDLLQAGGKAREGVNGFLTLARVLALHVNPPAQLAVGAIRDHLPGADDLLGHLVAGRGDGLGNGLVDLILFFALERQLELEAVIVQHVGIPAQGAGVAADQVARSDEGARKGGAVLLFEF